MSWKETLRKFEWIIPVVLIIGAFFGGSYCGQKKVLASIDERCDTITKVVSFYKDFPEPAKTAQIGLIKVPSYQFITETEIVVEKDYLHDTIPQYIYLPREQKYYEEADGKLRLWISGYDPILDRYEFDQPTTTITTTVKEKASRWGVSINGGYGAALNGKSVVMSPYIGIGISYTILRL